MPTYRKIDANTLGITPDEYIVTREQIDSQLFGSEQSQVIYNRDADALQVELNAQIAVLDS